MLVHEDTGSRKVNCPAELKRIELQQMLTDYWFHQDEIIRVSRMAVRGNV